MFRLPAKKKQPFLSLSEIHCMWPLETSNPPNKIRLTNYSLEAVPYRQIHCTGSLIWMGSSCHPPTTDLFFPFSLLHHPSTLTSSLPYRHSFPHRPLFFILSYFLDSTSLLLRLHHRLVYSLRQLSAASSLHSALGADFGKCMNISLFSVTKFQTAASWPVLSASCRGGQESLQQP